jgi:hypothetical protein
MNERPTPRTHQAKWEIRERGNSIPIEITAASFAASLERECDEAREHLRHLHASVGPCINYTTAGADERAALFNAWKAAGDYLATIASPFTAGEERERSKHRAGTY